jgi:hypothetical protein
MTHGSIAGSRSLKRIAVSLLATSCLVAGSPFVASGVAAPGAHKPVSAGFGDCKNVNAGVHNGYDCPVPSSDDSSSGGSGGVIIGIS